MGRKRVHNVDLKVQILENIVKFPFSITGIDAVVGFDSYTAMDYLSPICETMTLCLVRQLSFALYGFAFGYDFQFSNRGPLIHHSCWHLSCKKCLLPEF